jgi:ubiquinone/menaquinone biosynthesis C-methylase UbiE
MVGPQGAAYGVDTADGMLERAEREALRRGLHNAHFLKCPLDALTLPSAFADIIISTDALSHAQSKREVLTELHRVLKPGGRFVISDVYSLEPVPEHFREDTDAMAEGWAGAILRHEYIATLQELGFDALCVFEESEPYDMGPIEVVGFTVAGQRPLG